MAPNVTHYALVTSENGSHTVIRYYPGGYPEPGASLPVEVVEVGVDPASVESYSVTVNSEAKPLPRDFIKPLPGVVHYGPSDCGLREVVEPIVRGSRLPVYPSLTGRNQPCPCGSGRKYKRCHFNKEMEAK